MRRPNSTARSKEDRKLSAEKLVDERAKRSPKEQLKLLDSRLGSGVGAKRERTRLLERMKD